MTIKEIKTIARSHGIAEVFLRGTKSQMLRHIEDTLQASVNFQVIADAPLGIIQDAKDHRDKVKRELGILSEPKVTPITHA